MKRAIRGIESFAAALLLVLAGPASAAVLQFDFNTAQGTYSGSVSPGHALGDVPMTQTTWNGIAAGTQIKSSGLLYADGTAATGITIDLGAGFSVSDSNSWNYGNYAFPWGYAPGISPSFYDNALMRDYLYNGNGIGARVNGLPAGDYRVYLITAEPQQAYRQWTVGVDVNPSYVPINDAHIGHWGGLLSDWVATSGDLGSNYYFEDVSIAGPSDWLGVVMTHFRGDSPQLSGLQIVQLPEAPAATSVPEPATVSALAVVGIAGLVIRRRRA